MPPQRAAPPLDASGGLDKLQLAVQETERYGEMFLDVRAEAVYTDKRRQEARQALTALRKQQQQQQPSPQGEAVVLLTRHAGVVMHVPLSKAVRLLEKDQAALDARMEELRREEKRLMALLAGAGAGPSSVGPGMLNAMLNLRAGPGASGSGT